MRVAVLPMNKQFHASMPLACCALCLACRFPAHTHPSLPWPTHSHPVRSLLCYASPGRVNHVAGTLYIILDALISNLSPYVHLLHETMGFLRFRTRVYLHVASQHPTQGVTFSITSINASGLREMTPWASLSNGGLNVRPSYQEFLPEFPSIGGVEVVLCLLSERQQRMWLVKQEAQMI